MFAIRRIYDDVLPVNRTAIAEVREIFREQFPAASPGDIDGLVEKLRNPFTQGFRPILYVAEKGRGGVVGFAIVLHDPRLKFLFLDYIAAGKLTAGRGVGAALYEHIRDEALMLDVEGIFFECLPDDEPGSRDPAIRRQNAARLRFYENYHAYPLVNTARETPVPGGSTDNVPYLVFDGLDRERPLRRSWVRKVARAILERKYAALCPPEYVNHVVQSIRDDPVQLRKPRYRTQAVRTPAQTRQREKLMVVVNDRHDIHHVRERGYVESPIRIGAIVRELESAELMERVEPRKFPDRHVTRIHDVELVRYLEEACRKTPPGKSVYPYVFPVRNAARPPREWSIRAGYFCIDTFTPINRNAWPAARRAVDCALTAASGILGGRRLAYALVRPPGHHAERRTFGGFCYLNNAAIAADYLSENGRVALLDIDYHHGNGQQDIFWRRSDVLTVSIHGDPDFAYPYFTGFADECGEGAGAGYNVNLPLPEKVDGARYRTALIKSLSLIREFDPAFLVVSLGLDPAKGDPTGTWSLVAADFRENGRLIGAAGWPVLVVQEGGYRTRTLGVNARSFFQGLLDGSRY
jgi:acetoin utilization deacetylase AcuC-like enzyme